MKKFIVILIFILTTPLFSQRSDFYDSYDYDLRNQKVESGTAEAYKEYTLPAKRPAKTLIDPKKVQKDIDYSALIPQNSPFRSTRTNALNPNASPVNLFTGEINPQAILRNQEEKKRQKEAKEKALENFERPIYKESTYRRGEIIFLMTFPFALGASALIAGIIESSQTGFIKTPGAVALIGFGTIGLSIGNVWLDYQRNTDYLEAKKVNPNIQRPFEFSLPIYTYRF
jgi:hypothetical protein